SSPGGCRMPGLQRRHQTKGLWRLDISPKVLSPASERVAVLGRYALGLAGRLHVARQSLFGEPKAQCQESSNGATRKASITLTGLGKATILCADRGLGELPTCISIKQRDGGSSRLSGAPR